MKTSIYIKLIRYFIGLILITCLTCAALFLVTMGRPLARQAHTLVKNHVRFMAGQVEILMAQNDPKALDRFLTDAGRAYGMDLALFNRDMEVLAKFSLNAAATLEIRPEMRTALKKNGRWVQSGHLSGATIYLLPIARAGKQSLLSVYFQGIGHAHAPDPLFNRPFYPVPAAHPGHLSPGQKLYPADPATLRAPGGDGGRPL